MHKTRGRRGGLRPTGRYIVICLLGLGPTTKGTNRAEQSDPDDAKRTKYTKNNLLLWRILFRAIEKTTTAGAGLRIQIQDEFGHDHDGYELGQGVPSRSRARHALERWPRSFTSGGALLTQPPGLCVFFVSSLSHRSHCGFRPRSLPLLCKPKLYCA